MLVLSFINVILLLAESRITLSSALSIVLLPISHPPISPDELVIVPVKFPEVAFMSPVIDTFPEASTTKLFLRENLPLLSK